MRRAISLATTPGVPLGPNPRVGCVLLSADGDVIAEGWHRGAGSEHAEVDALSKAGGRARGATAVVSLEPCNHVGRTGPCSEALMAAGVRRVVYAIDDPHPAAAGGAAALRVAGVDVEGGLLAAPAHDANRAWLFGVAHQRPLVTLKFAGTLDGRSAARDGSSRWITNAAARADAHVLRAAVDTILVGAETVEVDNPVLTARDENGKPLQHQPLRVVLGKRFLSPELSIFNSDAPTLQLHTHDPSETVAELFERGQRHILVEGGPTIAAAFLRSDLVDEVVAYIAPTLLGSGPSVVADLGITSITQAQVLVVDDMTVLPGGDGEQPNMRILASAAPSNRS